MSSGMSVNGAVKIGGVNAMATQNTGLSIDYWTDRLLERVVYVADNSDSVIKDQAIAFKESIRASIRHYISNAIKSDRTKLYNLFIQQGHGDMAEILRRLN